jgi:hypothetical protein
MIGRPVVEPRIGRPGKGERRDIAFLSEAPMLSSDCASENEAAPH